MNEAFESAKTKSAELAALYSSFTYSEEVTAVMSAGKALADSLRGVDGLDTVQAGYTLYVLARAHIAMFTIEGLEKMKTDPVEKFRMEGIIKYTLAALYASNDLLNS